MPADLGLSQTAQEGIVLATRLLDFPSFSMTTGIAQVFEPGLAALVARSFRDTMRRGVVAAALDSRTRSRIGWLLFHLASLDPEDARAELRSPGPVAAKALARYRLENGRTK